MGGTHWRIFPQMRLQSPLARLLKLSAADAIR
jgi:hypothetical protein